MASPTGMARGEDAAIHADYESLKVAAEWYAVLQDTDVGARQRASWQRWLDARPEHRRAWMHVEAVSQRFAPLRTEGERVAAEQAMKVAAHRPRTRRQAIALGLAVGGMGLLGWLSWRLTSLPSVVTAWRSDYSTGIGEQRDILLSDNTRIWLNTQSAIDVDFEIGRAHV